MDFIKKTVCGAWLFCFTMGLGPVVCAQKNSMKIDSVPKPCKWDVSLDLYQLFYSGSGNVMIRYSPTPKGAFRLSIGNSSIGNRKNLQYLDSTGARLNDPYVLLKTKGSNLSLRSGYEFHKNSGRHQLYYGLDAVFIYTYFGNFDPVLPASIHNFGLTPFIGVKYQILNRLSLSAELSCSLSYRVLKGFNDEHRVVSKDKSYYANFEPLRFINISYHF
jgi:hypothetical protein